MLLGGLIPLSPSHLVSSSSRERTLYTGSVKSPVPETLRIGMGGPNRTTRITSNEPAPLSEDVSAHPARGWARTGVASQEGQSADPTRQLSPWTQGPGPKQSSELEHNPIGKQPRPRGNNGC